MYVCYVMYVCMYKAILKPWYSFLLCHAATNLYHDAEIIGATLFNQQHYSLLLPGPVPLVAIIGGLQALLANYCATLCHVYIYLPLFAINNDQQTIFQTRCRGADMGAMIKILVQQTSSPHKFNRLTAISWLHAFMTVEYSASNTPTAATASTPVSATQQQQPPTTPSGQATPRQSPVNPHLAAVLEATLACLTDTEKEIRETGARAHDTLLKYVRAATRTQARRDGTSTTGKREGSFLLLLCCLLRLFLLVYLVFYPLSRSSLDDDDYYAAMRNIGATPKHNFPSYIRFVGYVV
jgi:hypothetical protein